MDYKDLFIIGGGINGAAIAADAAGRGLSILLCEKNDIASATSSASTKLIHGGLRYLQQYEFKLVRKTLQEREILMRKAPHLITPLQFILPHENHLRPIWLMRVGLFIYDHLAAKKTLENSKYLKLNQTNFGKPLIDSFIQGFSYYDCLTDDARLTILNAIAAKENGGTILTHHEFISAYPENNLWLIKYKNNVTQEIKLCQAKILINASGPWLNYVQQKINPNNTIPLKLVKGSHIVVPKLYSGNFAYILQNADARIVFAIPYQNEFTLIGTTDVDLKKPINFNITISVEEENYLCKVINHYFKKSITKLDIVWSYAGVRCLLAEDVAKISNLSKISRDYKILLDAKNQPPLVTIVGGKLTTHRFLAEETVNLLKPYFPNMKPAWTKFTPLPGGDFPEQNFKKFIFAFKQKFSWLPEELSNHYAKNYGTRAYIILDNAKSLADLGENFTNNLYEKELIYLVQYEWAKTAEDILWRRTKFGLTIKNVERDKIAAWLNKF